MRHTSIEDWLGALYADLQDLQAELWQRGVYIPNTLDCAHIEIATDGALKLTYDPPTLLEVRH